MDTLHNSFPIPDTPHYLRVDLADRTRIWTSARALERSCSLPEMLKALADGGYLLAEDDRLLAWYGFDFQPDLDCDHSGAKLAHILLRFAAPNALLANLHLSAMGSC